MKKINVLDKYVAELIAAGEVVERPSSVVKELMENSIDAGASKIIAEIKNGGISLIRISDNGSGIYREDVKNAFLRHATSKVKTSDDLDSIKTLGFRGEALASICAVSRMEVLTACNVENIGTRYVIEGGEEKIFEDAGRAVGTTFTVKDLFFNTPARMKFLKKDITESNSVACVMDRIALSHPDISIKLIRDGKEVMNTPGDGKISSCIYSVYGKDIFYKMISIDYELKGVKVKGFIGRPEASRSSKALQNFFINNRYVRVKIASAALDEAFKGSIMSGKYPVCVIYIDVSYELVDVNVHPSKIEVRFINERPIFEAVYYAVKTALTKDAHKKEISFDEHVAKYPEEINKIPFKEEINIKNTVSEFEVNTSPTQYNIEKNFVSDLFNMKASDFNRNPFSVKEDVNYSRSAGFGNEFLKTNIDILKDEDDSKGYSEDENQTIYKSKSPKWDLKNEVNNLYLDTEKITDVSCNISREPFVEKENKIEYNNEEDILYSNAQVYNFKNILGEVFGCYILVQENEDKIIFIDKHAAHERIIYNNLKKCEKSIDSQILLSPITVSLRKDEYSAIIENLMLLSNSGYSVEDFGVGTVMVRSAPVWLDITDIEDSIIEISNYILKNKINLDTTYMEWLYHNIACRAAIKAGDKSSSEEILDLVKTLEINPDIMYCPHGRPIYISLSKKDIEKQFGRM